MPNGKPGDSPLNDIVIHEREVYSPLATILVREIVGLADDKTRRDLADLLCARYHPERRPDVPKLEQYLTELRNRLRAEARSRGFELDPSQ